MSDYVKVEKQALAGLLQGVRNYISLTKEASAPAASVDGSRVEEAIFALCENGLLPIQKRAEVIEGISQDPNRLCELLEKLASRVGPSSLGGGDTETVSGEDPELSFVDFCVN